MNKKKTFALPMIEIFPVDSGIREPESGDRIGSCDLSANNDDVKFSVCVLFDMVPIE
jgi:hypothetical protein